jgi:CxxC motif-containing protein
MEIVGARWRRLPVKVTGAVEKGRILEAARRIHQVQVTAPVKIGQVLIKDFLGEKGTNVVACRTMAAIV